MREGTYLWLAVLSFARYSKTRCSWRNAFISEGHLDLNEAIVLLLSPRAWGSLSLSRLEKTNIVTNLKYKNLQGLRERCFVSLLAASFLKHENHQVPSSGISSRNSKGPWVTTQSMQRQKGVFMAGKGSMQTNWDREVSPPACTWSALQVEAKLADPAFP